MADAEKIKLADAEIADLYARDFRNSIKLTLEFAGKSIEAGKSLGLATEKAINLYDSAKKAVESGNYYSAKEHLTKLSKYMLSSKGPDFIQGEKKNIVEKRIKYIENFEMTGVNRLLLQEAKDYLEKSIEKAEEGNETSFLKFLEKSSQGSTALLKNCLDKNFPSLEDALRQHESTFETLDFVNEKYEQFLTHKETKDLDTRADLYNIGKILLAIVTKD